MYDVYQRPAQNRAMERSWANVERGTQEHTYPPNRLPESQEMEPTSRVIASAGGAAMFWYGLRQDGMARWPLMALGAGLLYQGISGNNLLDFVPVVSDLPGVDQLTSAPTHLHIRKTLTVNRPANELYDYWRNLENLPSFMQHIVSVKDLGEGRSHWVANVVRNLQLEWDARITVDRPNEFIAWESEPDSDMGNRGYVKFIPTPRGTEVSAAIEYDPPYGLIGRFAGGMFKFIAEQQVKEEIRNFKRLMETGELPTTEGQPAARKEAWRAQAAREGSFA